MYDKKTEPSTQTLSPESRSVTARIAVGTVALGAGSAGALAAGALAIGAVAVGALAIGRLVIGSAKLRRVEIGELVVGSVRTGGIIREPDRLPVTAIDRDGGAGSENGPAVAALEGVGSVFYFVNDLNGAVAWYTERLGREPVVRGDGFAAFDVGGVRLTLHREGGSNSKGPAGVAVCWTVADVEAFVEDWMRHGAKRHRGPKTVFTGERLCQMLDPFGNLFAVQEAPQSRLRQGRI